MPDSYAYEYLLRSEVAFLDAAVARLIPADELGPGAKEAGVTHFIDHRLAGSWGTHGRNYRAGPWQQGTPQQGCQSRMTPQEIFRTAIGEIDENCLGRYGKRFWLLSIEEQDAVLQALEKNEIELASDSAAIFFGLLLRNTVEGFFADPLYGGNQDKIGWRLIGFPGVPSATYAEEFRNFGVPYRVEPVGIQDIQANLVSLDSHGLPKHVASKDG